MNAQREVYTSTPPAKRKLLTRIKGLYGPARRAWAVWELEFNPISGSFHNLSVLGSSFMEVAIKLSISQAVFRIK